MLNKNYACIFLLGGRYISDPVNFAIELQLYVNYLLAAFNRTIKKYCYVSETGYATGSIVYKIPYRRARLAYRLHRPLGRVRARAKEPCIRRVAIVSISNM